MPILDRIEILRFVMRIKDQQSITNGTDTATQYTATNIHYTQLFIIYYQHVNSSTSNTSATHQLTSKQIIHTHPLLLLYRTFATVVSA